MPSSAEKDQLILKVKIKLNSSEQKLIIVNYNIKLKFKNEDGRLTKLKDLNYKGRILFEQFSNIFFEQISFSFSKLHARTNLPSWKLSPLSSYSKTLVLMHKPAVNFINFLRTHFLYKHCFGSFFYIHVCREKLPKQHLYKK